MDKPVDLILHCPRCGQQHIDAPDLCPECPGGKCMCVRQSERWTNPPHRSHLCGTCAHIWRPSDAATNGVASLTSKGAADSPVAVPGLIDRESRAMFVARIENLGMQCVTGAEVLALLNDCDLLASQPHLAENLHG